jgi:hypothetical protein
MKKDLINEIKISANINLSRLYRPLGQDINKVRELLITLWEFASAT